MLLQVGMFLGRTTLFCGGFVNGSYSSDCHELDPYAQKFFNFSLPEKRGDAALVSTSQGLWMTGSLTQNHYSFRKMFSKWLFL